MTDLNTELWHPLPSGGGHYEVSTFGRIRSVDRHILKMNRWGQVKPLRLRGRVLKHWSDNGGYSVVYLCGDGRREAINVHRLIAEVFCQKVEGKEFVNHKDGNKANNEPSNLEWCTRSENMQHAHAHGLCPTDRGAVIATPKRGGMAMRFLSSKAAAIELGSAKYWGNIKSALVGFIPSAYGYTWAYETTR